MSGDWEEDLCKRALMFVEEVCSNFPKDDSHNERCDEFRYLLRSPIGRLDSGECSFYLTKNVSVYKSSQFRIIKNHLQSHSHTKEAEISQKIKYKQLKGLPGQKIWCQKQANVSCSHAASVSPLRCENTKSVVWPLLSCSMVNVCTPTLQEPPANAVSEMLAQ